MNRNTLRIVGLFCVAVPIAFTACKRAETPPPPPPPAAAPAPTAAPAQAPFRVSSVAVGNALDADKRVTSPSATFAPGDTIYASVATVGVAPEVTLAARWTYGDEGQLVNRGEPDDRAHRPGELRVPHRQAGRLARWQIQGRDQRERQRRRLARIRGPVAVLERGGRRVLRARRPPG